MRRAPLVIVGVMVGSLGRAAAQSREPPAHHALPGGRRFESVGDVPWRDMRYQGAWRHPERWAEHLAENVVRVRRGRFADQAVDYLFRVVHVSTGDLDGDGADEAAVATLESMGREIQETIWVYAVREGRLVRLGTLEPPDAERGAVLSLAIRDGRIHTRRDLWRSTDPTCCPGLRSREVWKLVGRRLALRSIRTRPLPPPE